MHDLAVRAIALVVFVAVVGGGAYAAEQAFGQDAMVVRLSTATLEKSVAAGSPASFDVVVENRGAKEVTVVLALPKEGPVRGAFDPQVRLAPGASSKLTVLLDLSGVRGDLPPTAVPVRAMVDGRNVATLTLKVGVAAPSGIVLTALENGKIAASGWRVTFPVVVENRGPVEARITLSSPGASHNGIRPAEVQPAALVLAPGASKGAFVTFDTTGARSNLSMTPIRVQLPVQAMVGETLVSSIALDLAISPAQGAAQPGDQAVVDYVGRFANGTLFDTSLQEVGDGPFPKPADFRRPYEPLTVGLSPSGGTIPGFWQGLVGMGPKMSRTITIPASEAYGNATQVTELPRTQEVPRHSEPQQRVRTLPVAALGQFLPAGAKVGDTFQVNDQQGNTRTFRVSEVQDQNATIVWIITRGDAFTLLPQWPKQSFADVVTETEVVFLTTPTNPDQSFTFYPFWPDAARIVQMTADTIVVQHNPTPGMTFQVPSQRGQVNARVAEVTATVIRVESPNEHPLAGMDLTFDLHVREVRRGPTGV